MERAGHISHKGEALLMVPTPVFVKNFGDEYLIWMDCFSPG
jgi:hypothetical protein